MKIDDDMGEVARSYLRIAREHWVEGELPQAQVAASIALAAVEIASSEHLRELRERDE